jgi:hypothetical protein
VGLRLLNMGRAGILRIDVSAAIIDEVIRVPREDFRWEGYRLHFAREKLAKMGNVVVPSQSLHVIEEDPDDDRILECAAEPARITSSPSTRSIHHMNTREARGRRVGEQDGLGAGSGPVVR